MVHNNGMFAMACENNLGREKKELQPSQQSDKIQYTSVHKSNGDGESISKETLLTLKSKGRGSFFYNVQIMLILV